MSFPWLVCGTEDSTSPTVGIPALGKGWWREPLYQYWSSGTASAVFTNANKNRLPGTADGTPRHAWALAAFCQQFYVISKDHSFVFECSKTLLMEEGEVSLDSLWSSSLRCSVITWLSMYSKFCI